MLRSFSGLSYYDNSEKLRDPFDDICLLDRCREKGDIHTHSAAMIDYRLEAFSINASTSVSNPLAPGTVLTTRQHTQDYSVEEVEHKPYRQLVGSPLYCGILRAQILRSTLVCCQLVLRILPTYTGNRQRAYCDTF